MSQSQAKKNKKRKPKAVSQSRPSRKLAVNKNEIEVKNTEEEDSSATVRAPRTAARSRTSSPEKHCTWQSRLKRSNSSPKTQIREKSISSE
ncbi:hypothetical protein LXL04_009190 [Taraxacum kok-saghyz]